MNRNRTGCLIGLLTLTALIVVVALVAARLMLDWSERGETVSINLPFAFATPTPMTPLPAPPRPTATPEPPPATATPAPPATGQPQAVPTEAALETAPGEPEAIILVDPSLSDLASELTSVTSGQDISISMSEDALQAELAAHLGSSTSSGYEFHSVSMEPGRLIIKGKGQMDMLVVNFTITVRPYVTDCWFVVDVESVQLGKFPAPAFVNDEIQTYVDQWTEAYGNTDVFCVTEISVTDAAMVLIGYVQ